MLIRTKLLSFVVFGTHRYLRMPFGLQNAPTTIQRLIDQFQRGLKDVFALSYLDDIIVLAETFDKHLDDLKKVFERLSLNFMQTETNDALPVTMYPPESDEEAQLVVPAQERERILQEYHNAPKAGQ
ncbi:retrovirus-related Pol polyprotein from transposon 297 [Trichonephila clavipes]|nr:retrovirus-related Pol polyprotein from transposon 297 [Trichonephila clavipes]